MPGPSDALPVARLDQLGPAAAAAALLPCCASRRWADQVASGRPYDSLARLVRASDVALAGLDWADIEEALVAHPRIGAPPRPPGPAESGPAEPGPAEPGPAEPGPARREAAGREAAWSAQEQQGTAALDDGRRAELHAANVAYEQRFGYVFLICASGQTSGQMLAALHKRLGHDPATEREVIRRELRDIVTLRLGKAFL